MILITQVWLLGLLPASSPEGGRGCLMLLYCLKSQGCRLIPFSSLLSFFSPILLLFLSCHSANGPFSWLFSRRLFFFFFVKRKLLFFVRHLLSDLEMIMGRWYVQLAAKWCWYLQLVLWTCKVLCGSFCAPHITFYSFIHSSSIYIHIKTNKHVFNLFRHSIFQFFL